MHQTQTPLEQVHVKTLNCYFSEVCEVSGL